MPRLTTCSAMVALALLLAACGNDQPPEEAASPGTTPSASASAGTAGTAGTAGALVPGTAYHAITNLACIIGGVRAAAGCPAGVKRGWSDDGGAMIEITKPDGSIRTVYTDAAGTPMGADSSEADGSAGWTFIITPRGDTSIVDFGPEHYEIPQALVLGG